MGMGRNTWEWYPVPKVLICLRYHYSFILTFTFVAHFRISSLAIISHFTIWSLPDWLYCVLINFSAHSHPPDFPPALYTYSLWNKTPQPKATSKSKSLFWFTVPKGDSFLVGRHGTKQQAWDQEQEPKISNLGLWVCSRESELGVVQWFLNSLLLTFFLQQIQTM